MVVKMENYQLIILVATNVSIFIGFISSVVALHIHSNKLIADSNKEFNDKMYALEEKYRESVHEPLTQKITDLRPKESKNKREK